MGDHEFVFDGDGGERGGGDRNVASLMGGVRRLASLEQRVAAKRRYDAHYVRP